MTKIEWAEKTWNAFVGCSLVSPGCTNCYAMRMANRLVGFGRQQYVGTTRESHGTTVWSGQINRAPDKKVREPLTVKRPTVWFVNSMSDLFHQDVDPQWVVEVIDIMNMTPRHTYQVLTKRPEQAEQFFTDHPHVHWPDNAWLGVSIEDAKRLSRIDVLRRLPGRIKFISAEPLLGPLGQIDLTGIHWVIGGGESGPGARPCQIEWVRELRDECRRQNVAFFMKQWGKPTNNPLAAGCPTGTKLADHIKNVDPHGKGGALVDGELWRQYPVVEHRAVPAGEPPLPSRSDHQTDAAAETMPVAENETDTAPIQPLMPPLPDLLEILKAEAELLKAAIPMLADAWVVAENKTVIEEHQTNILRRLNEVKAMLTSISAGR